jgi:hypothetical protein
VEHFNTTDISSVREVKKEAYFKVNCFILLGFEALTAVYIGYNTMKPLRYVPTFTPNMEVEGPLAILVNYH